VDWNGLVILSDGQGRIIRSCAHYRHHLLRQKQQRNGDYQIIKIKLTLEEIVYRESVRPLGCDQPPITARGE